MRLERRGQMRGIFKKYIQSAKKVAGLDCGVHEARERKQSLGLLKFQIHETLMKTVRTKFV